MHKYSRKILMSIVAASATLLFADDAPITLVVDSANEAIATAATPEITATVVDAPATDKLINTSGAESNDLLKLARAPGRESDVSFSSNKAQLTFERPQVKHPADDWTKDTESYRDFEAVQVEVKDPLEHTIDSDLVFAEPTVESIKSLPEAANEPIFESSEEFGQPGVVYTQDDRKKLRNKAKAADAAAEAKRQEFAELDGEESIAEVVDTLKENAEEIQRRIVLDDSAPPMFNQVTVGTNQWIT